ncbi:hypothetical protein J7J62_04885 [bacterium]|nr:hypothetical protein [bacterium]
MRHEVREMKPKINEIDSGYYRVVLGDGKPGTEDWRASGTVLVEATIANYVMKRLGKREIDREVLVEAAAFQQEMDAEIEKRENNDGKLQTLFQNFRKQSKNETDEINE